MVALPKKPPGADALIVTEDTPLWTIKLLDATPFTIGTGDDKKVPPLAVNVTSALGAAPDN